MASLKDVGQTQMGKTGTVKLTEIGTKGASQGGTDGYDRTFVTAANDYKRVNPFEVAAADAPDPIGITTPYSLADWEGYQQWDSTQAKPSNVNVTDVTTAGAGDGRVTITWSKPSGFDDFDTNGEDTDIHVGIYILKCADQGAASPCGEPTFEDPFTGTQRIQDGTSYTETSLDVNSYYIIALRTEWDDESGNATTAFPRLSDNGDVVASPGETCCDTTSDTADDIIYFKTPDWVCTPDSLGVATSTTDPDGGCAACDDFNDSPVDRWRDGAIVNGTTIFTNDTCSTEESTNRWISDNGTDAYRLDGSNQISSSTGQVDCTTECKA